MRVEASEGNPLLRVFQSWERATMDIRDVKHIRTVSTNSVHDFQARVNELLQDGYVLLQIGSEIEHDKGRLVTPTMAVLGSDKPAPLRPQVFYRPLQDA